jgi:hypothetical protein
LRALRASQVVARIARVADRRGVVKCATMQFQNRRDRFKTGEIVSKQAGSFQNRRDRFKTGGIVSKQAGSFQIGWDRFTEGGVCGTMKRQFWC